MGTGDVDGIGAVENATECAELRLGDEQVTVVAPSAPAATAREQVRGIGDEGDLAAVGVERRRPGGR